ncbi:efflux RND transporter periplasmic adaptor subunit [Novosphingobium pokkalii]|uniref:Efflux RND transporter periplasmic adaptor subunit n=1 Tax=Novosphingobium pokkalii TaxID=1770194 RepID=A0ABV7V420_9SPHN|nr:efflux RND transporter periplasmic adaptor subunit [Novosphingobium pokkalii]
MTAAASDTPDWQSVSAEVTSQDQAQVLARIPGILTTLSVRAGDSVHKGQLLGRIADSQLTYQSAAYGAQAAAAQAQAAQAKAELDRVKFLAANGVYAKARLEQAEAGASAAAAQTQAARAQQASVRAMAGNGAVIAPATGRVLRADVPAGSPVAPGMVVAVVTSGPVVLRLDLPEALAAKVKPGARVRIEGMSGEGSVTRIYPAVTAGQVSADVAMAGLDASLIGRRLAAQLAVGTHRAMIVPRGFVMTRYGLDYVQVVGKSGRVMQVPVQTAPAADSKSVEILSGVNAGDVLVAAAQGANLPAGAR